MMMTDQRFRDRGQLLALAALLLALTPACRGMRSANPPLHLNPNMDNVTYVSAQEPSDFFDDGRGMRPQVDGTIARGELREDDHLYRGLRPNGLTGVACEDNAACGEHAACDDGQCKLYADAVPPSLTVNHDFVARGQERFNIYCTPCHGEAGLTDGGTVPRRAAQVGNAWAVPSLHGDRPRGYAVGQLYDVVTNGFNTMPAYAAQIPVEDRWAIATYVRALQVSYQMQSADLPTAIKQQQGWN